MNVWPQAFIFTIDGECFTIGNVAGDLFFIMNYITKQWVLISKVNYFASDSLSVGEKEISITRVCWKYWDSRVKKELVYLVNHKMI